MSSRKPVNSPSVRTATRRLSCRVISSSASKMKSSASTAMTSKWQTCADRRVQRQAPQQHRLGQVHAGDDADPAVLAHDRAALMLASCMRAAGLRQRRIARRR